MIAVVAFETSKRVSSALGLSMLSACVAMTLSAPASAAPTTVSCKFKGQQFEFQGIKRNTYLASGNGVTCSFVVKWSKKLAMLPITAKYAVLPEGPAGFVCKSSLSKADNPFGKVANGWCQKSADLSTAFNWLGVLD